MNKNNFTHLHVHDYYSFLDGYDSPKNKVKRVKELGMTSLASTNHNHLGGCLEFQKECLAENIKPILGVELYYTEDTSILSLPIETRNEIAINKAKENGIKIDQKAKKKDIKELIKKYEYDTKQYHIIFLAKNQTGWNNLVKLQSEASKICTYNGRYICDDNLIEKYKDGIIMTTACIGGIVNNYILKGEIDKAYKKLDKWHKIFKDDFYIEIQPLSLENQAFCNYYLIQYALNNNIKLIATNDSHYTYKDDVDIHDTLLCIGLKKLKSDKDRMKYIPEYWLRSYDEMIEAFTNQYNAYDILKNNFTLDKYIDIVSNALNNTNEISNKVDKNIKLGSDKPILPKVDIPNGLSSSQYLTLLSYKGLFKYIKENNITNIKEYIDRLAFELSVINTKGYSDYMLIVKDIINWCESQNIPTGPGRGSASGSLCLFVNGITKCIDPIKYGLLFSRFLTVDRTSLPDIDSDFSYLNRPRVIQYLKNKYGDNCVSFIGTYSELGVKNGLKDVGRVLNYDFTTMNNITKKIDEITDDAPSIHFKDIDKYKDGDNKEQMKYSEFKKLENEYKELFKIARMLEGTPRNTGVHASGVLVSPIPINDIFPTITDNEGNLITLYTGPQVEECGGVKIDILGLKTLDVLDLSIKAVDKNKTVYDLYKIVDKHTEDKNLFKNLNNKETEGIFQLESPLFKGLIDDIKPKNISDIILLTAIGRPGPLNAALNKMYARRLSGEEEIKEPLKNTMNIVKDSLGVIVYQEHAMRIAQQVAGFDDNQADSFLRKAMAKKKKKLLELCNQWFIYGKINKQPPKDYDYENKNQVYYDPKAEYGKEIKGGIANGYIKEDLENYIKSTEAFCSYLFNKSHAACYAFLSLCTLYLKHYHKTEFFAALLTMQQELEKIDLYCSIAEKNGIEIITPDINLSDTNFVPNGNKILYGLNSIKGVGETSIPNIINNKPYKNLEDAYNKIGKKYFNKRVGESLIKAGAFDFEDKNRNKMLNKFIEIRKATKKEDLYNEDEYNKDICMDYEIEKLGSSITYKSVWDTIGEKEYLDTKIKIDSITEKIDKKGNMMAFIKTNIDKKELNGIVFASIYCNNTDKIFKDNIIEARIIKESKDKFTIKKILNNII